MNMAGVDKFGVIFTVAFVAAMIVIMGTFLQVDNTPTAPSVAVPSQTYSPPTTAPAPSVTQQAAPQTSSSENLKYIIRGAIVESISQDEHHNAVKIIMDSRLDGQLTITLTSDSVTPFDDGAYFVTVDGEEVDFTQVGKKLTIDFMANSQKIMIFGEGYKSGGHDKDAEHEAMMANKAAAADKAAADKAAADKAAADKAAADKAAALPMSVSVENATGSSSPGCEPYCFIPNNVTVAVGGTVSFVNSDTAPHTSTSGSPSDGPSGVWDSSLVMPGATYDTTISSAGTYDYFCMVHPWMTGTVIAK